MEQIPLKPAPSQATRTETTKRDYIKVARQLCERFEREQGVSFLESPLDGVRWLASCRPNWTRPTWRRYKSAMVFLLQEAGEREVAAQLQAYDSSPCKHQSSLTSAQKMKKIPYDDLVTLVTALIDREDRPGTTAGDTRIWLLSAIATGLRPEEWRGSQLNDTLLEVRNAKATNDRSFGPTRRLDLSGLSDEMLSIIGQMVRQVSGLNEKDYEGYYNRVRLYLYRLNKELWPRRKRRITLYSGRHQFSANIKSRSDSRAQVAASMGHGSTETAGEHYGRRSSGYEPSVIAEICAMPTQGDVLAVEARNAFRRAPGHPDDLPKKGRKRRKEQ